MSAGFRLSPATIVRSEFSSNHLLPLAAFLQSPPTILLVGEIKVQKMKSVTSLDQIFSIISLFNINTLKWIIKK